MVELNLFLLLVAKPITVGWGKKETQFHGSEGKQAAVKKQEVNNSKSVDLNKIKADIQVEKQEIVLNYIV